MSAIDSTASSAACSARECLAVIESTAPKTPRAPTVPTKALEGHETIAVASSGLSKASTKSNASRQPSTSISTSSSAAVSRAASNADSQVAICHVHRVLRSEAAALRSIFMQLDPKRDGFADRGKLQTVIVEQLHLPPKDLGALRAILDVADPGKNGRIEFGRLMRLVRSEVVLAEAPPRPAVSPPGMAATAPHPVTSKAVPPPPPTALRSADRKVATFIVADDDDLKLRRCFADVNTGDKLVLARLWDPRAIPRMPTGARTSNVLGDSRLRAPWAIAGDDERMSHILTTMHQERVNDLRAALLHHAHLEEERGSARTTADAVAMAGGYSGGILAAHRSRETTASGGGRTASSSSDPSIARGDPKPGGAPFVPDVSPRRRARRPMPRRREYRLTVQELFNALREFDPFVHDKEVLEYFRSMVAVRNSRMMLSNEESQETGGEFTLPATIRRATIGVEDFLARYGQTVMTTPAMRCSATFAVKWDLPAPLPPKPPLTARAQRAATRQLNAAGDAAM
mgnify:FL=1